MNINMLVYESLSDYIDDVDNDNIYYYHLSMKYYGEKIKLIPRVPQVNIKSLEDGHIPRICVSTSIDGCILGSPYVFVRADKAKKFRHEGFRSRVAVGYVYAIKQNKISPNHIISNKEIVKRRLVFDADVTDETWITKPIDMNYIGKIKIHNNKNSKSIKFKPLITTKKYGKEIETWLFPYRWINKKE